MTNNIIEDLIGNGIDCPGDEISPICYILCDVSGDGAIDTQVVFETIHGVAYLTYFSGRKMYYFTYMDDLCGGSYPYPERGEFVIHFVDTNAPGWDEHNRNTWIYKRVSAARLKVTHDYGTNHSNPYSSIQAYQNRGQINEVLGCISGGEYKFTDPVGIEEIYITTDFTENNVEELYIYNTEQAFICEDVSPSGLVLLYDTSGSMSWSHDGIRGIPESDQRLTLAKRATYPFLDLLNDYCSMQMAFGIATFPRHPWEINQCNGQIILPMTQVDATSIINAKNIHIPSLIAEGMTPLLSGISNAWSMFYSYEPYRVIALLSDGYHNCPSRIDALPSELRDRLIGSEIKVYSIAFGTQVEVDKPLLQSISADTGGLFYDVTDSNFDINNWDPQIALHDAYKSILVDALNLQCYTDPYSTIMGDEKFKRRITLSKFDMKVSFFLSWVTPKEERLDLSVKSSDGQLIPNQGEGIVTHKGETYKIITLDEKFLNKREKVGDLPWEIEISGTSLKKTEKEKFQYCVILDSKLKMKSTIQGPVFETDANVTLKVKITENGNPITNLTNVYVKIFKPSESIGKWFLKHKISSDDLSKIPKKEGNEILTYPYRKALSINKVHSVELPSVIDAGTLELQEGIPPGEKEGIKGVYWNTFTDTSEEGSYLFHFFASGETKDGIPFKREFKEFKYIAPSLSIEKSDIEVTSISSDYKIHRLRIAITPRDNKGNIVGFGHTNDISLDVLWGKAVQELQDNFDGSYSQEFDVPTSIVTDTELRIRLRTKKKKIALPTKKINK